MKTTSWLNRAVIYHLFIDRFYRGGGGFAAGADDARPEFCGGNLQGVTEKLDYLCELGINTIWLSPFHPTTAYHGYHVTDFFRVEERFGGEKAFRALVKAARARHLRLIMDLVPNHISVAHPVFRRAKRSAHNPFRRWFYWDRQGRYQRFLKVKELAKLNLDEAPARRHVIQAAKHWIDEGIAGFRLDHALGPSMGFWQAFRDEVKAYAPDTPLIGEVLFGGIHREHLATIRLPNKQFYYEAEQRGLDVTDATMREYAGVMDGLLDFSFQKLMVAQIARRRTPLPAARLQALLDEHYALFPPGCALLSFLDNHDMNRFLFEARGDLGRLRRAAEMQFAQSRPPVIYYGTEMGMNQTGPVDGDHGDLRARRLMPWDQPNRALFQTYQRLIGRWKEGREPAPPEDNHLLSRHSRA